MRFIIIQCILASIGLVARGQLNFKGNPLTENIEYTAEETHFSERNARRNYESLEIDDGRTVGVSNDPFSSPADEAVAGRDNQAARTIDKTKSDEQVESGMQRLSAENEEASGIGSSFASHENTQPTHTRSNPSDTDTSSKTDLSQPNPESRAEAPQLREYPAQLQPNSAYRSASSQDSSGNVGQSQLYAKLDQTSQIGIPQAYTPSNQDPKTDLSQPNPESRAEARQLREYSAHLQPNSAYRSASSQDSSGNVGQSQLYAKLDQPSQIGIPQAYAPSNQAPISLASGQALNKFLKSRTPEESQTALQHYLRIREYATQSNAQSAELNVKGDQNLYAENAVQTGPVSNQMPQQDLINSQAALLAAQPSVLSDATGQMNYSPAQHAPLRWNQVGFQSRQDSLVAGPGRRPPPYRGQFAGIPGRVRGNPWSQSRIGPGTPLYHHKGPGFAGPPAPPPGFAGKWKPPVQVIYTRPPGHLSGPPNNHLSPEDASRWFPDVDGDQPSPQKDILYSQLYAQSYDPHYYNYIANTGKIKPWLYGKLGEPKEKSIWWELFSGFKRHGMKNIMNPMFLLGMTIPTLTLMLTALVHKRSLGRSFSDGHVTEELIEEYARRLREAIECNAKLVEDGHSGEENRCW